MSADLASAPNYYAVLEVSNAATAAEIRRAYRELSKRYHPDTTQLPLPVAKEKFQQIKDAYVTLNDPKERHLYDVQLRLAREASRSLNVPPLHWQRQGSVSPPMQSRAAYLDPTERPLSSGELFVLFVLGLAFLGCLLLAIAIGLTRGDDAVVPVGVETAPPPVESSPVEFYIPQDVSFVKGFPTKTAIAIGSASEILK